MTLNLALAQVETPQIQSTALVAVIVVLLAAGLAGWLAATVLGFTRARATSAARWFALSALCLVIYHLHFLAFALLGTVEKDMTKLLSFGSFFNLFVVIGSVCAVVGFLRLPKERA
ncbi:MAG TPA: hypothetical protein VM864_09765 [Pyrinomonadaceae bacterium]|jgi:hypothetical protein|nr:hypothetical protein [Pyrinomonadaceae bacterium]